MIKSRIALALLPLLALSAGAPAQGAQPSFSPETCALAPLAAPGLARFLPAGEKVLRQAAGKSGAATYQAYWSALHQAALGAGDKGLSDRLSTLLSGGAVDPADRGLAGQVLRAYLIGRYGEAMIADLRTMVTFQTYAQEGHDNWDLPEFRRQRDWLRERATSLGLTFQSIDGRVEEITLAPTNTGKAPQKVEAIGLLTHGDVQDVVGQQWSSPPFEARLVGDRIIGRGTEDDKGPIIAALYTLAALADTGWRRPHETRLLIANAEESSWAEIAYYLERRPAPAVTLGLDAAYPVTHAQKGYGVVTVRAEGGAPGTGAGVNGGPGSKRWRLHEARGGSGLSIIPERGEAFLVAPGPLAADLPAARDALAAKAAAWVAGHPAARLEVTVDWPTIKLTAHGKGGHSSAPESGHNALGDLSAFLATLDLELDRWGALVKFLGLAVGTETDGASLGIRHSHSVMGPLTVSLAFLETADGVPQARLNTRVPAGLSAKEHERRINESAARFAKKSGAKVVATAAMLSEPHLVPLDSPLVGALLAVWQEVVGTPGRAVAIGGGTQARLFPGGVDFGPAEDMVHYRGHGTDEFLTPAELHRIAELTATAVLRLQSGALPKP